MVVPYYDISIAIDINYYTETTKLVTFISNNYNYHQLIAQ